MHRDAHAADCAQLDLRQVRQVLIPQTIALQAPVAAATVPAPLAPAALVPAPAALLPPAAGVPRLQPSSSQQGERASSSQQQAATQQPSSSQQGATTQQPAPRPPGRVDEVLRRARQGTLAAVGMPNIAAWVKGVEKAASSLKRSFEELMAVQPLPAAARERDAADLAAALAAVPASEPGLRAIIQEAMDGVRDCAYWQPQAVLFLSQHSGKWGSSSTTALQEDQEFAEYFEVLRRAFSVALTRQASNSAAARLRQRLGQLPSLDGVPLRQEQVPLGPAATTKPEPPSKRSRSQLKCLYGGALLPALKKLGAFCLRRSILRYPACAPSLYLLAEARPVHLSRPCLHCPGLLSLSAGLEIHMCHHTSHKSCKVVLGAQFCTATQQLIDSGKAHVRTLWVHCM